MTKSFQSLTGTTKVKGMNTRRSRFSGGYRKLAETVRVRAGQRSAVFCRKQQENEYALRWSIHRRWCGRLCQWRRWMAECSWRCWTVVSVAAVCRCDHRPGGSSLPSSVCRRCSWILPASLGCRSRAIPSSVSLSHSSPAHESQCDFSCCS